jgi:IclR family acetate operon transcriptional repressor
LAALSDERVVEIFGEACPGLTPRSITSTVKLLEELRRVRRLGYAIDNGETILGRCCVAMRVEVPTLDGQSAAVSISSSSVGFSQRRAERLAAVRQACEELSRESVAREALASRRDVSLPALVGS